MTLLKILICSNYCAASSQPLKWLAGKGDIEGADGILVSTCGERPTVSRYGWCPMLLEESLELSPEVWHGLLDQDGPITGE